MHTRGRSEEDAVQAEYLAALHRVHADVFASGDTVQMPNGVCVPVLRISGLQDFHVDGNEATQRICGDIIKALGV